MPARAAAFRLCLAIPAPVQGGGVGLSARGDGAVAPLRGDHARERAARRLSQGRAGPALRRRQSRRHAWHLPRRHRARRIRRHGPAHVVGDHPAGVGRPAGLGGVHRHPEGAQRLLRAVAALAEGGGLVLHDAQGERDRAHPRQRARVGAARSNRGAIRPGIRLLLRRRRHRRLLRKADDAGRGRASCRRRAA